MRLVLASNNAKKLVELQALFDGLGIELVKQGDLGVAEAEEPHATFIENALAKARHASMVTGLPAIADDSGLCVEALGGAPGVISAHYAPMPAAPSDAERESIRRLQDEANNALLLARLAEVDDRRAAFCCTLVALRSASDPQPLVATGRWPGEILRARRGAAGFGYDPLMYIPAFGATVAELPAITKNTHSHRARAAAHLQALLHEAWPRAT
ncbi:MAG TPA: RdgB/HAM1 family non-canonical purine NTP pyrophosphatase [Burkholderiaceae bacterium]|nr:RdgB/HAM1 family non-canonical purine NTP pyrophosphatase [Burkholderiaceae bacterium]